MEKFPATIDAPSYGQEYSEEQICNVIGYLNFREVAKSLNFEEITLIGIWGSGKKISDVLRPRADIPLPRLPESLLDLNTVLDYMKLVVKGVVPLRSRSYNFGMNKNAWLVYSKILQDRYPDDPEIRILTWRDETHRDFRNPDLAVRLEASAEIC